MRGLLFLAAALFGSQAALAAESLEKGVLPKILGAPAKAAKPSEPAGTAKSTTKPSKYTPPRFKVALPSGKELSQAVMELPKDWTKSLFPNDDLVYVAKYPSDKVQGVHTFYQGKLNGPAATLYEDGGLAALVNYSMSDRDGTIRLWEENKRRLLYAETKRGKMHGAVCLFRDDLPWFVQEYDMGDLTAEYLVKWKDGTSEVLPRDKLTSDDLRETAAARTRLTELEAEMDRNEARVKKALREWFQEKDKEVKQKRVAKQSSTRREEQRKKQQTAQKNFQKRGESAWRNALRAAGL